MKRRRYLQGLVSAGGIVTVGHSGKAYEHDAQEDCPEELPPRKGDSVFELTVDPIETVDVGIIGLGNRGSIMTTLINGMYPEKGEIKAICDIREEVVEEQLEFLQEEGQDPDTYTGSEDAWKELVERDDLDLVFVFTDWENHAPMSIYSMEQGKHVATEIPAATTIEDCWKLVDTAEQHQKHCMMLENVNYFEEELWVLNMAKEGIFGDELTFGRGAYVHNLIPDFLFQAYWDNWRARGHYNNKGDLYPTHGLGPIAHYMDILRGDRMEYITTTETPSTRLAQTAQELDPEHEFHGVEDFAKGDTTSSLIATEEGRSIELQHDVVTNRGYTRYNTLAGSDAYHENHNESLLAVDSEEDYGYLEEDTYDEYWEEYRHPLWEVMGDLAEEYGGHGGGDFLMIYRLFDALNHGRPLDQNVYEAAAWSAVRPLSAISLEHDGKPVRFPDFTRGEWEEERELEIMKFDTINDPAL